MKQMPLGVVIAFTLALQASPEQRAVDYLSGEVASWPKENHCFSCHNNGDAARALFIAAKAGYRVSEADAADTKEWLLNPRKWNSGTANPIFGDPKLAHIQFAAALAQMEPFPRATLIEAAKSLLPFQQPDGSWTVDVQSSAGSPVTYGPALATYMARQVLMKTGDKTFDESIARATRWLAQLKPRSQLDTSALILAFGSPLPLTQSSDGGWGPHVGAPSEPFDTAVAILALLELKDPQHSSGPIARGRAYLLAVQLPNGGWPETTRPPGSQSYAQHVSTSAWATIALLMTDPKR